MFCFFVVLLMSDVCLSAFLLLLLLLLPLLLPAPENKLTPHTYHHTQSLCECVCVFACLCVCACVSPFLFCAAIHSGTMERGELNWTELKNLLASVHCSTKGSHCPPSLSLTFLLLLTGKVAHFKQHKREEDRKFQLTNRTVDVAADMTSHDFHFHFVFLIFFFWIVAVQFRLPASPQLHTLWFCCCCKILRIFVAQ